MSRRPAGSGPLLLLLAEPLQREGLRRWLQDDPAAYRLEDAPLPEQPPPALVLWSLSPPPHPDALAAEVVQLLERWQPAPLLLLLPADHPYPQRLLLSLPVQGVLQQPDPGQLRDAVATLLAGGRVVEILPGAEPAAAPEASPALGFGQWLLVSGLQQIDAELRVCARLLDLSPANPLAVLLLEGRQRELRAARALLLWLWGPVSLAWGDLLQADAAPAPRATAALPAATPRRPPSRSAEPGLSLTLRQRSAEGIWRVLRDRLGEAAAEGAANRSGELLALDGLHPERRRDLLLSLLEQFHQLRDRLQREELRGEALVGLWNELQPELRRQALRQMAGSYVQLPSNGVLRPVAESLIQSADLNLSDPELPDPMAMLMSLLQARPLLVEGRLLGADEPQAVLYLEMLLANWLVRTAELISAEVLAACADWPELRRYLLRPELLATRNLERLRNQLNGQQRWSSWISRPIQLYESRRPFYTLESGAIGSLQLMEPRDAELRRLGWLQQLVTLALEARDALGPQVQGMVRALGDLLVVLLTQVVGRAIGLVGRGIAQGMGRSLASRSESSTGSRAERS